MYLDRTKYSIRDIYNLLMKSRSTLCLNAAIVCSPQNKNVVRDVIGRKSNLSLYISNVMKLIRI